MSESVKQKAPQISVLGAVGSSALNKTQFNRVCYFPLFEVLLHWNSKEFIVRDVVCPPPV